MPSARRIPTPPKGIQYPDGMFANLPTALRQIERVRRAAAWHCRWRSYTGSVDMNMPALCCLESLSDSACGQYEGVWVKIPARAVHLPADHSPLWWADLGGGSRGLRPVSISACRRQKNRSRDAGVCRTITTKTRRHEGGR